MIIVERVGDRDYTRSDAGFFIRQETGILYKDAMDVPGLHTYEETDIPLPVDPPSLEDKAAAYDVLVGGAE